VALQTTRQIEHWTRKRREACALRNPYVRFEERYHWPPKKSSDLDESQVVLAVAVEIKRVTKKEKQKNDKIGYDANAPSNSSRPYNGCSAESSLDNKQYSESEQTFQIVVPTAAYTQIVYLQ